jgi:3-oxoadipate enol-lactonase
MGAMIGQVFALKYPAMLKSLVLCDTTSSYPAAVAPLWAERIDMARREGMAALADSTLERWFTEPFRKTNPETMQRFRRLIVSTPVAGYAGCSEALVRIHVTDRLKELRIPALIMVGEHDLGTPVAMARAIHESLPGSELAVVGNAAHFPNVEQPETFSNALLKFLERRENVAFAPSAGQRTPVEANR